MLGKPLGMGDSVHRQKFKHTSAGAFKYVPHAVRIINIVAIFNFTTSYNKFDKIWDRFIHLQERKKKQREIKIQFAIANKDIKDI